MTKLKNIDKETFFIRMKDKVLITRKGSDFTDSIFVSLNSSRHNCLKLIQDIKECFSQLGEDERNNRQNHLNEELIFIKIFQLIDKKEFKKLFHLKKLKNFSKLNDKEWNNFNNIFKQNIHNQEIDSLLEKIIEKFEEKDLMLIEYFRHKSAHLFNDGYTQEKFEEIRENNITGKKYELEDLKEKIQNRVDEISVRNHNYSNSLGVWIFNLIDFKSLNKINSLIEELYE